MLLTSGDNPRNIKKIAKFNAGGVVLLRLASAPDASRGSWAMGRRTGEVTTGVVEGRGSASDIPRTNVRGYHRRQASGLPRWRFAFAII